MRIAASCAPEMDYLVIENFLIAKTDQPPVREGRILEDRVRARLMSTSAHAIPELDRKGLRDSGW